MYKKILDGRGMDKGMKQPERSDLLRFTWQQEEANKVLFDGDKGKDLQYGGNNQPPQLF